MLIEGNKPFQRKGKEQRPQKEQQLGNLDESMKMIRRLLVQKDVDQKTLDTFFSGEAELLEVQGSYQRWTNIGCSKHSERCLSHFSS